ncbi:MULTISPECIES: IS110 family transposase [Rhodococcus]|nr:MULTISPECIES: IS110 family transposase [Rhodococcus]MBJ7478574.1 IS110 family transposase [Rhodococcus sp. (in: high G+C Gram-positive bacteria)]MBP1054914.1 IS110 family transposase [Rhodococcus qingshengii]MCZ4548257.1 IS110 family transposase [Rhodococcus qingshengii]
MMYQRTSVGLDVHALSVVACAIDGQTGEVWKQRLCPDSGEILAWLRSLPGPVKAVYEAGPTGFGLYRALNQAGVECVVVAPSKLQRPAGDRVKTDARDALHLARLLRLDEIVEVTVPSVEQEAARDLVRAREDARGDLMRCRHRLSKLLLRQGIVYSGGAAWTGAHDVWLRSQRFEQSALQATFDSNYEAMLLTRSRRDRLDTAIEEMAENSPYTPMVHRLGCLRGISTLTGFGLAVEIGDWQRFTGSTIGSYVGLVPSEYSSGTSRSQGSITKTGNGHARRLLVEAAWHHRKIYRNPGQVMRTRWAKASPAARARGHAGNHRLHHRWEQFTARKKRPVIANVAVARELAGWCWSLAVVDDQP